MKLIEWFKMFCKDDDEMVKTVLKWIKEDE